MPMLMAFDHRRQPTYFLDCSDIFSQKQKVLLATSAAIVCFVELFEGALLCTKEPNAVGKHEHIAFCAFVLVREP